MLVEAPLLATPRASELYRQRVRALAARLDAGGADRDLVVMLSQRWMSVLRSFARAPEELRQKVLGLQTDFADPGCAMAQAISALSRELDRLGLFSGRGGDDNAVPSDGIPLSRGDIAAVLTCMMVNAADTMPDGSEALFYMGALIEHSCAANTKFCVYQKEDAPESAGVSGLPEGSWVGEWCATRAIREGEPVTTSYLEKKWLDRGVADRRGIIFTRMGFVCRCARCCDEDAALPQAATALEVVDGGYAAGKGVGEAAAPAAPPAVEPPRCVLSEMD